MSKNDSEQESRRLSELYASMADGELQKLAHEFAGLSPTAQAALESEFRRRDLTPEVDLYAPDAGIDVLEWEDLVMLRRYRDLPEALLAKGSLESAGIAVVLVDENIVRTDWLISNLIGGIKLCVHEQDEDAALDLLEQSTPEHIDVEGVGVFEQPACPACHSLDIQFEALNRLVAYGSLWLGVPIPLKRKRWRCSDCGHVWKAKDENGGYN